MLKFSQVRKIWWPVVVSIPQDGGKVQQAEFEVEFEILDQKVHDELVREGADLADRVLLNWRQVKDESGTEEVPFTPAKKAELLDITYVRAGLITAYYDAVYGRKAKRKN